MEDIDSEINKLSKINSASLINLRINNIWLEINKAAVKGKYFLWNSNLDRIWCELGGDIKEPKEGKEEPKEIKEFNKLDKKVSEKMKKLKTLEGFEQFSKKDKLNLSELYDALLKKEFFLRRLMNKQGKGTAYQDSFAEYIHG